MSDPVDLSLAKARRCERNNEITPEELLKWALDDIRSGEETPTRAMVLFWNDQDTSFETSYYMANLRSSEQLALLEMIKARILAAMGLDR